MTGVHKMGLVAFFIPCGLADTRYTRQAGLKNHHLFNGWSNVASVVDEVKRHCDCGWVAKAFSVTAPSLISLFYLGGEIMVQ